MVHRASLAIGMVVAMLVMAAASVAARQTPQALVDRAEAAFAAGRFAEALGFFDQLITLVPDAAPMLWQRGITLYELGRFDECAKQFASYFAVDRRDLENASWHFLCQARATSVERARASMLAAGPDPRILRDQVYAMFAGRMSPEALVDLANTSVGVAQFYAYLYAGLYREAAGDRAGATRYFTEAASDRYQDDGGFMNVVARVHLARLKPS